MNVNREHGKSICIKLPLPANGDRLDSWKQIAVYLGREVRTVQRWEKLEALPVRRHTHVSGGTVYALKNEIDAWLTSRGEAASEASLAKKHPKYEPDELDLPPHVVRQLYSAFRLWLAIVAPELAQDRVESTGPDSQTQFSGFDDCPQRSRPKRESRKRPLMRRTVPPFTLEVGTKSANVGS